MKDVFLWPDGAPGGWEPGGAEITESTSEWGRWLRQISEPRLTFFGAWDGPGPKVLILPGGGYFLVAIDHEGLAVGEFFAERGIASAVLSYRLPRPEHDEPRWGVPLEDARRAWSILSPLGARCVMGFSAGGHLAACLASCEPSVAGVALVYPAYLVDPASGALVHEVTPLPHQTAFLVHHEKDEIPAANSLAFFSAIQSETKECHLLGGSLHGGGIRLGGVLAPWALRLADWIKSQV